MTQLADAPAVLRSLEEDCASPEQKRADGGDLTVAVDGKRIVLSAFEEIVLRCGEASITLTRSGKILIRGEYVSTHSAGVNRIKGATVEIN
jgi:hypothetical protein